MNRQLALQLALVGALVTVLSAGLLAPFVFASDTDTDGDGMPDAWETANGLNPGGASDASQDPDGDGFTNLEEYKLTANPNVSDTVPVPSAQETYTYDPLHRVTNANTNGVVTETFTYDAEGNITSAQAQ